MEAETAGTGAADRLVSPQIFSINITLEVNNGAALWAAAVDRGMSTPFATVADIVDVIGPQDDPDLGDCLAMLLLPTTAEGCIVQGFTIDPILVPPAMTLVVKRGRHTGGDAPYKPMPSSEVAGRSIPFTVSVSAPPADLTS